MKKIFLLSFLSFLTGYTTVSDAFRKYNTSSKRLPGAINVHLVPHTHDDVGWLKTPDQYYYGNNNQIQRATVQNILNSVIKELAVNPDRKFIYVEQFFFQTWWAEQSNVTKQLVHNLVANGQLEFLNGGWVMHDEAAPSFADMIDQTTLGHRFLVQEFNVTPKTTWQIDPFGHSTFQAYMMSSAISGYNALFFMRDDYQDMEARQDNRTTEWIWAPSPTKGMNSATYAGILFGGYCTLSGLDMSIGSNDAPIMDDQNLEDYNVGNIVIMTVDYVMEALSQVPQGNTPQSEYGADILLPLGCDFNYENAATWYTNTDKLIHWLNQDGRVNAFYSTPSIYAAAKLNAGGGQSYTLREDDLYPYGFFPHGYLTGFYTSRPALKGYIRDTSSLFHAATQIQAVTGGAQDLTSSNPLFLVERAIATSQHHDGITGSSKQHVAYDYAKALAVGRLNVDAMVSTALQTLTKYTNVDYVSCDLSNATICPVLQSGVPTVVAFWNQQSQTKPFVNVLLPVGFPDSITSFNVYDSHGNLVVAQILPLSDRDISLREEYYGTNFTSPVQWLAFQVSNAVPVGYVTYFIVPVTSADDAPLTYISIPEYPLSHIQGSNSLTNDIVTLNFDTVTGLVTQYTNSVNNQQVVLNQTLLWYNSSAGPGTNCHGEPTNCDWNSGAYIFRPNGIYPILAPNSSTNVTFIRGPVVNEARQTFATWATQIVRLWSNISTVDFEWTIGPIPYHDNLGREVISYYGTNLATNSTWYTDSNGRDSNKRIRNYRPAWNYTVNEPVSGNYFPSPGFIYTEDINTGATLSILPDRSEGGTSITDGALELMIHRRLQYDDALGVGEPLNETGLTWGNTGLIVKGLHQLSIDTNPIDGAINRRNILQDMLWKPTQRYAVLNTSVTEWIQTYQTSYTALTNPLPANVYLLTMQSQGPKSLLLRLSHSYEANEGGSMANDVQIDLASIFTSSSGITLQSCTEMTLTANQQLANAPKWTYNVTDGPVVTLPVIPNPPQGNQMTITLSPMDIRTFMCTLQ